MRANLVAVQARLDLERYRSFAAFRAAMSSLTGSACAATDPSLPSLLVFPEGLGLFLSFAPFYDRDIAGRKSVSRAVWQVGLRHWPEFLVTAARFRTAGLRTALLRHALEAREAYLSTFSDLARREGAYIVAGTAFLPDVEERALHLPRIAGRDVFNVAPTFGPSGALLAMTKKVYRASRWERRFAFARGSALDAHPVRTRLGNIGVLVCHDSQRETLLRRQDALGAQVLAVPAFSLAPWQSQVRGRGITQEQAWLDHGLPGLASGRENIEYAVCAMLVGEVFDLRSEGRSFVCRAAGERGGRRLLAVAGSHVDEETVCAQVEIGETADGVADGQSLGLHVALKSLGDSR